MRRILFVFLLFPLGLTYAQTLSDKFKPQWVTSFEDIDKHNPTYEYKVIVNEGPDLNRLRNDKLVHLGSYLKSTNQIDGTIDKIVESENSNVSGDKYRSSHKLSFSTKTSVEEFDCMMIDDYWEQFVVPGLGMQYRYYTLFAVSTPGQGTTIFDEFTTTTQYGVHGLWRSAIVPGWGQFYKRDKLKGGIFLGGTVALAGGIVFTENQRANYFKKITKTHSAELKRAYATRSDHFATGRNICIGAVVALYVYNLVDAVVAPGARRVVVHPKGESRYNYALSPTIMSDGTWGVMAAVSF
ncbi:MAG: hypothetical protein J6C18_11950 [Bacteroidaceae bacterium]|nr:hypothetical protein [Bacteroidaceae bacterium]